MPEKTEQTDNGTESEWVYAKRDCPRCGSSKTWTNENNYRCHNCGRTTVGGGFSRNTETKKDPLRNKK